MKITCGAEIPYQGFKVAEVIQALSTLPPDAQVKSIGFDTDFLRVWWDEER